MISKNILTFTLLRVKVWGKLCHDAFRMSAHPGHYTLAEHNQHTGWLRSTFWHLHLHKVHWPKPRHLCSGSLIPLRWSLLGGSSWT